MERDRATSFFVAIIDNLIWVIVIVAFVVFSLLSSRFFTLFNLVNILPRVAALGLLVIGQSFTMTTAHFDLSSESNLGLTAMVGALFVATTSYGGLGIMMPPGFAIVLMILLGLLVGSLNGFMITKLRMNNLVATIAMLILLRGVVWILSPGKERELSRPCVRLDRGRSSFHDTGGRQTYRRACKLLFRAGSFCSRAHSDSIHAIWP